MFCIDFCDLYIRCYRQRCYRDMTHYWLVGFFTAKAIRNNLENDND